MHLYWKVFEELKCLGEFPIILDPSLKRCFLHWMVTHEDSLIIAEERDTSTIPGSESFGVAPSLN